MTIRKKKKMKLVAHQVVFSDNVKITFQDILEQLKNRLPTNSERLLSAQTQTDASVIISKFLMHPSNMGVGAVFSFFHKDAEISTIAVRDADTEVEFNRQAASEGQEYLDHNILLFGIDDMIISCGIGNRANTLRNSIHQLAVDAGIIPHTTFFNFVDMPRGDALDSIRRIGVKHVEFDATFLLGTLPKSLTSNIIELIFGSGRNGEAIKRRRENTAKLVVKSSNFFGKGAINAVELDKNTWLDGIAERVVEDIDTSSYTIILNDGEPIKSGSLLAHTFVDILAEGSSFDVSDAHSQMVTFYHNMQNGPA